ncbi:GNAT family N-acetyltransferase [Salinicoccus roseus]|uniref:GNAT family N-acetyltransferase n=1 Tax=Salinicoccus roseus TaxID=45670 RepID=UPI001EF534C0|nr:GNAT family N-acetyltransferase [Salinicoccus roseus]MCG7331295.1 GNAT family N-acetyltransferase [Salinicoccus roseus]
MEMMITRCTENEWKQLQEISHITFDETFRAQNKPENMEAYLSQAFTEEKIKKELSDENSQFFFVYAGDEPAGYLKVNIADAQTEEMGSESLEIERIYILKAFQNRGLGRILFDKAMDIADEMQASKIWLGVWEKNNKAIAFYKKLGFSEYGSHSFYMGDEEQTDIIMVKPLAS